MSRWNAVSDFDYAEGTGNPVPRMDRSQPSKRTNVPKHGVFCAGCGVLFVADDDGRLDLYCAACERTGR